MRVLTSRINPPRLALGYVGAVVGVGAPAAPYVGPVDVCGSAIMSLVLSKSCQHDPPTRTDHDTAMTLSPPHHHAPVQDCSHMLLKAFPTHHTLRTAHRGVPPPSRPVKQFDADSSPVRSRSSNDTSFAQAVDLTFMCVLAVGRVPRAGHTLSVYRRGEQKAIARNGNFHALPALFHERSPGLLETTPSTTESVQVRDLHPARAHPPRKHADPSPLDPRHLPSCPPCRSLPPTPPSSPT
jgi:hypothetical protein